VQFSAADAILQDALTVRFTAAVLRVELAGRLLFERAYGAVDDAPGSRRIEAGTRFDLASLTKIFASTAALRAVVEKKVSLDGLLAPSVVPEWRGTGHEPISLRMLLAHTSGMQSGADYRTLLGHDVERFAVTSPLVGAPGERVLYSDLGFIALGTALERLHRRSLASVLGETSRAAGAATAGFRPPARGIAEIPATEEDGWRGRVRGLVHDEKAYLMGGVAAHAGLFGTALDVASLAGSYLGAINGRSGAHGFPASIARESISQAAFDPVLRRGLGWALKTSDENSCGRRMSPATFGHTGFTGTCLWADPERDLSIVLLTNAVYYGRNDLRDLRAAVCDAVVESVDAC
jgi:CubicO group peptidase (beta-lactamase class C family)